MAIGALPRDTGSFKQRNKLTVASGQARDPDTLRTKSAGGLTNCGADSHLDGGATARAEDDTTQLMHGVAGLPRIRILEK
jgi:hypothetical protein